MINFIRHAESNFNLAVQRMKQELGPQYQKTQQYLTQKFHKKYLDVEITQKGVSQALEAREIHRKQHYDIVLVSPLRRAIHTCAIIFENHPSKLNIVVEPAFREIMESSNDIGSFIQESMQKYPHFDFRKITDKEAWFVQTLRNQEDRKKILTKIQGTQGKQRQQICIQETLKIMKESWTDRKSQPEEQQVLKLRVLPIVQTQKAILADYMKQYKRIAVVAHSECIKMYSGYTIGNCQTYTLEAKNI